MTHRLSWIASVGAVAVLTLGTGTARAATVENGNFETGNLDGWGTDSFGPGGWGVYSVARLGPPIPAPPQGASAALAGQGEVSAAMLSQVVKLERGKRHKLKFKLAYDNDNTGKPRQRGFFPGFRTPNHFKVSEAAAPNQQFRMDVMKPDAPIRSLKAKHVLESVYITERGDPNHRNYFTVKENLTQHAGEKVRLRFAFAGHREAPLAVGVDAVKIKVEERGMTATASLDREDPGSAVAALGLAPAVAGAAKVKNGGFEAGSLGGWQKTYYPSPADPAGAWIVYGEVMRGIFPAPPQGEFAAVTNQGDPSAQILSQVVKLRDNRRHKLSFQLAYSNSNEVFQTPGSLRVAGENQQFRMDVMKPGAPIRSVKGKHVLEHVYRTDEGDPNLRGYGRVTANLTPYAGEEVRLRFAVVVTESVLNAGIDAVKVRTRPAG